MKNIFERAYVRPAGIFQQAVIQPPVAWHSVLGDVHHDKRTCEIGNNIEPWNARPGDGGKPIYGRCANLRGLVDIHV